MTLIYQDKEGREGGTENDVSKGGGRMEKIKNFWWKLCFYIAAAVLG